MIGENTHIKTMWEQLNQHPHLIAYSGPAHEGQEYSWMCNPPEKREQF
jgi:hypothetical protein